MSEWDHRCRYSTLAPQAAAAAVRSHDAFQSDAFNHNSVKPVKKNRREGCDKTVERWGYIYYSPDQRSQYNRREQRVLTRTRILTYLFAFIYLFIYFFKVLFVDLFSWDESNGEPVHIWWNQIGRQSGMYQLVC